MNPDALTFVSVCSGIESASVAWEPLGMRALWFSEIEPFPCAVLKHHWPHTHNWGDFTKIPAFAVKGVGDILVGGTPCQAFSVAGKRESLGDDRGNLTLEFCRLADVINPPIIVWENVPGVLTTDDNAFGCFLAGLCGNDEAAIPCDPPTEQEINLNAKNPNSYRTKGKILALVKKRGRIYPEVAARWLCCRTRSPRCMADPRRPIFRSGPTTPPCVCCRKS